MDSDSETETFEDALDDLSKEKITSGDTSTTKGILNPSEFDILKEQDSDSEELDISTSEYNSSHSDNVTGKEDNRSHFRQWYEQSKSDINSGATDNNGITEDMQALSKNLIGLRTNDSVGNTKFSRSHVKGELNGPSLNSSQEPTCEESVNRFEGDGSFSSQCHEQENNVMSDEIPQIPGDSYLGDKEPQVDEQVSEADDKFKTESEIGAEGATSQDALVIEENLMKEREALMSEEEKETKKEEAQTIKADGNTRFKEKDFNGAIDLYTQALLTCPTCYVKERSIMYSNRAACRFKLEDFELASKDCSKALELNTNYLKALLRRAECYEKMEKLDEALEDYQKALSMDPSLINAREACMRLPDQIKERNEKMKAEMLSKLKDLGNMVLRPFGLSTNNFQLQQDPNTGSYSVNFQQNVPKNGPES